MENVDSKKFKNLLLEKKERVQECLDSLQSSSKPVSLNDPIGRLSRMDAIQHQQMSLVSKKRAILTLTQIEAALKRIECDSYGICLSCDDEIVEKRLLARPEVSLCSQCQE
jgi:DnaK suppressor protein